MTSMPEESPKAVSVSIDIDALCEQAPYVADLDDFLRQLDFALGGGAEAKRLLRLRNNSINRGLMTVSEQHGPP